MVPIRARFTGLVLASHAGPAAVVTLLTLSLSAGIASSAGTVLLVTSAVLLGQLSVGWSNDWLDAARDQQVGRTDKPTVVGAVRPDQLRNAALAAFVLCAVLSFATGWISGALHVLAVASAWAYNARLKATWASWVPYAVSFGLLPTFIVAAAGDGRRVAWWTVLAAALLGVGAHLANGLPDIEDDAATGVRGLPQRLGRQWAAVLAPVVLLAATLVIVTGPNGTPSALSLTCAAIAVVLAVAAGVTGLRAPRSRLPFAMSMAVAAVCVFQLVLVAPSVAVGG